MRRWGWREREEREERRQKYSLSSGETGHTLPGQSEKRNEFFNDGDLQLSNAYNTIHTQVVST